MLRHDIQFNNKHDLKFIFRWNELFRIREIDSIKKIYVLKKLNEARFNEIYAENRLKRFRTWDVQTENVEEEKFDLTLNQKNAEKFEKKSWNCWRRFWKKVRNVEKKVWLN